MAEAVLTPQGEDFPRWYQEVVAKAELAETGPARGTMIIKPWGYAIWERVQSELDRRIKETGHSNVYFPMFIPMELIQREAEHVDGFSPELAVVTHGGGKELTEPLAVRPTSETTIGEAMSRWIQGHRDLPLLLNQWANIVRWELRPRLFLRTTEFLWQEGHTAHATWEEAMEETLLILTDVYDAVMRDVLAIPTWLGRKTDAEKFAGAVVTYTLESLMRDGKALQMGTSHNLGENFARAFDITFSDDTGTLRHANTTSWGVSTRVIGGVIMAHGDDGGLRLPPAIAPSQVVVVAVREETIEICRRINDDLRSGGIRSRVDVETGVGFGRRVTDWELKGVPVRLEIGPRDIAAGQATVVRRDRRGKEEIALDRLTDAVATLLTEIQHDLYSEAMRRQTESTREASDVAEIDGDGAFVIPWASVGRNGEQALAERGFSVRCLQTSEGDLPAWDQEEDLIAVVARAY